MATSLSFKMLVSSFTCSTYPLQSCCSKMLSSTTYSGGKASEKQRPKLGVNYSDDSILLVSSSAEARKLVFAATATPTNLLILFLPNHRIYKSHNFLFCWYHKLYSRTTCRKGGGGGHSVPFDSFFIAMVERSCTGMSLGLIICSQIFVLWNNFLFVANEEMLLKKEKNEAYFAPPAKKAEVSCSPFTTIFQYQWIRPFLFRPPLRSQSKECGRNHRYSRRGEACQQNISSVSLLWRGERPLKLKCTLRVISTPTRSYVSNILSMTIIPSALPSR